MNFIAHRMILRAIEGLRGKGSWTGKTHVIKTLFLASCRTQLPFDYILYKHGPYSFDVETELEQMRSYRAVDSSLVSGYGPQLKEGPGKEFLTEHRMDPAQAAAIDEACRFVGSSDVAKLEALASVAWIRNREGVTSAHAVVARLRELKPHIPQDTAVWAEGEVRAKWLAAS